MNKFIKMKLKKMNYLMLFVNNLIIILLFKNIDLIKKIVLNYLFNHMVLKKELDILIN